MLISYSYIFFYDSFNYYDLNVLKITIKKNGVIVRKNQFTITAISQFYHSLIVPIVTAQPCKVNFYWNGPNSVIKVYAPIIMNVNNAVAAYTYANGTKNFPINLNATGTWYVLVIHNNFDIINMKNVTVRIKTLYDSPCTNKCF